MTSLRSTPLRLTGILILIFSLFALGGYGVAFLVTQSSLSADVAARIDQTVEAFRSIPERDEIIERAAEIAAAVDRRDMLLRYSDQGGLSVGNLPEHLNVQSGAVVPHSDLPFPEEAIADSYLAWHGEIANGTLTLLASRDSLADLGETFSKVLLFSLVPALLLATIVGALFARTARNRVEAIRKTLDRLTSGENGARVPLGQPESDDLGQIALAVNRMAAAQEASIEAMRQVSSDIAHDLRTPIQRVAVLLDKIEKTTLTGDARAMIATARSETAQIVETFHALLQIAQIESGQARSRFSDVDLTALATSLADVYGPACEETGHVLTLTANAPVIVRGDRTLLGRLIANLIENVLRHTHGGQVRLVVRSEPQPELSISDEGPGIPESEHDLVLQRLYRLERSRTSEGSGLGLSLVAAIAKLHNADLQLENGQPGLSVVVAFQRPAARSQKGVGS